MSNNNSLTIISSPTVANREIRLDKLLLKSCKSAVWKHFGCLYIAGRKQGSEFHCVECFKNGKEKSYGSATATANYKNHLKVHDIEICENVNVSEARKFLDKMQSSSYSNSISAADRKKKLLARRLALIYCRDLRPARSLCHSGMVDFVLSYGIIDSADDFPANNTISGNALDDVYDCCFQLFKEEKISLVKEVFHVLIDCWTDKYAKQPYINLSIQFIDAKFKFHCYKIFTEMFERPHTAGKQAEKVMQILTELGLNEKKFYLVGDSANTNFATSRNLGDKCLGFNPCIEHRVHNLLKKDLENLDEFEPIKDIMCKVKKTHGALVYRSKELKECYEIEQREKVQQYLQEWEDNLLEEMQADEEINDSVIFESNPELATLRYQQEVSFTESQESFSSFKSFVPTRWYSNLTMIKSYAKNHGMFIRISSYFLRLNHFSF